MLAMPPPNLELCGPTAVPVSSTNRPELPRPRTLKTFNLPPHQLEDVLLSSSSTIPAPPSGIFGEHPLRILIAPSGFKEALEPEQVADAIEAGIRKVLDSNSVILRKLPLHDGGEGFARALVAAYGGAIVEETVTGPVGLPVESHLGFFRENQNTVAVLDMASAAGLRLVPTDARDPTVTTTYGVGELVRKALDAGCTKVIIGCGDSGTSDGGAGMLQALGVRLLDTKGKELPKAGGGRSLSCLDRICWCGVHPRLRKDAVEKVHIEVVCNVKNVLCGPRSVARVYGPQKGATPSQVDDLVAALERLAQVAQTSLGKDISQVPGSGASGGLGAGLLMLGARLRDRSEAINEYFEFDRVFEDPWDFVITAEGSLDLQSADGGKMVGEVARRAKHIGVPVIALAGTIGEGADDCLGAGIKAFTSILRGPLTLEEAIVQTENLVKDGAEKVLRMIMVGLALERRHYEGTALAESFGALVLPDSHLRYET